MANHEFRRHAWSEWMMREAQGINNSGQLIFQAIQEHREADIQRRLREYQSRLYRFAAMNERRNLEITLSEMKRKAKLKNEPLPQAAASIDRGICRLSIDLLDVDKEIGKKVSRV